MSGPSAFMGVAPYVSGDPHPERLSAVELSQANRARLAACPRHSFGALTLHQKTICAACGGAMEMEEAEAYVRGFIAAGGIPEAVWGQWQRYRLSI